jgi:integrase
MKAAGNNRHGHRDATMILLAFRHGLRASELCSLRWEQVDLTHGRLHVHRLKNGMPSVHPLTGTELRALRRLQREQEPGRYKRGHHCHRPMYAQVMLRNSQYKAPVGIKTQLPQVKRGPFVTKQMAISAQPPLVAALRNMQC